MKSQLIQLTFEIELKQGEKLTLPDSFLDSLGAGKWLITIQPKSSEPVKSHDAFLNSYTQEDEGLYDDYSSR